jgi:hypothetical protein
MKLAILIFLCVLLLIFTVTYKRTLHLFEIIFIGMMVWITTHSVSSILVENLELISISQDLEEFWLHVLTRLILYPLITVLFIDLFVRIRSKSIRILIFVTNVITMTLLELLNIHLGVIISLQYSMLMSIMEWTFTMSITYLTWYWYRKKIFNEVTLCFFTSQKTLMKMNGLYLVQ